jgi:hypothetical protein
MGLAACREVTLLAQSDHLFDDRTQGLRLGDSGLNALFGDERRRHVPQQRAAVAGGSS